MSKLSQALRVLRVKSGLRNYEIAEKLGITPAAVSGHMSETDPYVPSLEMLIKYADIFKVPLESLINLVKEDSKPESRGEKQNGSVEDELLFTLSGFTDDELKQYLKLMRYMDRESQELIINLIRKLSKEKIETKGD